MINTDIEEYIEMNNQAIEQITSVQSNMNALIKRVKEDATNKAVELFDGLKTKLSLLEKDNELLNNKVKETDIKIEKVEKDYCILKDATYVLATDDSKKKILTKLVNSLVYKKYSSGKNTLKDKLFHRAIVEACYGRMYAQFEVNSFTRIKIEDFDEAIKVTNRFYSNEQNIKHVVTKKLKEYIDDKHLNTDKKKMVEEFLNKSEGGKNLWY